MTCEKNIERPVKVYLKEKAGKALGIIYIIRWVLAKRKRMTYSPFCGEESADELRLLEGRKVKAEINKKPFQS